MAECTTTGTGVLEWTDLIFINARRLALFTAAKLGTTRQQEYSWLGTQVSLETL